jgi:twitching motility two-component system response regulator PilG
VSAATDTADLQGARVLVIDDSQTTRRTAENLLTRAGCEVRTAQDGFEALGTIVEFRPDLVFVDVMMPRLDGYHTCALIKGNASLRHTPVVMLSSKDGIFDRAKGRLVGAELYLSKPFTGEELVDAVRRYLRPDARGGLQ